jgi:hypothetical protein
MFSAATITRPAKIARQVVNASTAWPMDGASTGTRMNTVETKDMTRAMPRPAYTSRTIAIVTMRGPAAPKPASARPASNQPKLWVNAQITPPKMNKPTPKYKAGLRPVLSETGP